MADVPTAASSYKPLSATQLPSDMPDMNQGEPDRDFFSIKMKKQHLNEIIWGI